MALPPPTAITVTCTPPQGLLPAAAVAGTSTVPLVVTMTTSGRTAQEEVGPPEIRVSQVQDTAVSLVLVGGWGVPVELVEVAMEEITVPPLGVGVAATTATNQEVHRRATITIHSREMVMELVAAAEEEEEGVTVLPPLPRALGATPLVKALDDILLLELLREAPMEVGVPRGNIQTPQRAGEPLITMEEDLVLVVQANLDKSLPGLTVTDHHQVVVVVVV